MSWWEIMIIVAAVAFSIAVIAVSLINRKKGKTCCGDCSGCSCCSACKKDPKEKK